MPKCLDCGNTKDFIVAYIQFATLSYKNNELVFESSGDHDRYDETYPPECRECNSTNIEGDV